MLGYALVCGHVDARTSMYRRQRSQPRLDGRPLRLQEGRQRQALAEVLRILVEGEAGPVGRNLEEDAARLAEVDRAELSRSPG